MPLPSILPSFLLLSFLISVSRRSVAPTASSELHSGGTVSTRNLNNLLFPTPFPSDTKRNYSIGQFRLYGVDVYPAAPSICHERLQQVVNRQNADEVEK